MSDSEIRDAERAYRASGAPQDGEAYVQAVLRSTGLNSTFLIARVIETQRALAAMAMISRTATYEGVRDPIVEAMRRPVTPDDMVSFLRGGREWLEPPVPQFRPTSLAEGSRLRLDAASVGSTDGYRRARPAREATSDPAGGPSQMIAPPASIMIGRQGTAFIGAGDPNAHLPHQRGVFVGDRCLFPNCSLQATVHGELALAMYCEIHAEQVDGRTLDQVLSDERTRHQHLLADANAHLPHQRGVPRGDAILCNHANENPGHCSCAPDCYCRQDGNTCSDVRSESNPFDRQCGYCSNEATWRFRYTTVVPNGHVNGRRVEVVCGAHLAQVRQERTTFNYDFMNRRAAEEPESLRAIVRHHEAVDGDIRRCAYGACEALLPLEHVGLYCDLGCAQHDA